MKRYDVVVIGGSASGIVTAITAKGYYPNKSVLVIRKEKDAMVPCGIPYLFGTLGSIEKNIVPVEVFSKHNVELLIDEVEKLCLKEHKVITRESGEIGYEKLVIATGSLPWLPDWLEGRELENVFTISKYAQELKVVVEKIKSVQRIVVVGGGFIGVEVSDELVSVAGKDITLIEAKPHILPNAFDASIAEMAQDLLRSRGVKIETGVGIKRIVGRENKVCGVELADGRKIDCDAVILAMGYRPNTSLAKDAGLWINTYNSIRVDEYMRTSEDDVFAVGDCAEKRDFVTRRPNPVMLASTACAEARVAGMNLFKLSALKRFNGTIAIFSTCIGQRAFGAAGLIESFAEKEGFDIITAEFQAPDRHPQSLPGSQSQLVKLIVSAETGILLGAEVVGGISAGELINVLGACIQAKMDVMQLATMQIGSHPLLTAAPTKYPVVKAAEIAIKKLRSAR